MRKLFYKHNSRKLASQRKLSEISCAFSYHVVASYLNFGPAGGSAPFKKTVVFLTHMRLEMSSRDLVLLRKL